MVLLKDIFFGEAEGKDEAAEARERDNFESIFYSGFHWYEEMLEAKKFLIVGRKGTGKTLLAEYYKHEQSKEGNLVDIVDDSNFTLKKLERINYRDITEQEMIIFWEYFFLYELCERMLDNLSWFKKNFFPYYKKLVNIHNKTQFELKRFSRVQKDSLEAMIAQTTALQGVETKLGTNVEESVDEQFEQSEYYKEVREYKRLMMKCGKSLKGKKLHLIFDDLDELEIFAGTPESKIVFINSMVKTVKRLNQFFRDCKIDYKVFLLMRQDMADDLNKSNNFNKVLNSNSIRLNWAYNKKIPVMKQPLTQMIIKKIKYSNPVFYDMNDKEIYDSILPTYVSKRPLVKYIIDYSFGRPRDFVMLLNTIKSNFGKYSKIKTPYVTNSIPEYSNSFYKELENEINRSPNNAMLRDGLLLIKDNQLITFTLEDLTKTYEKDPERYIAINNSQMISHCMKELYRYNVVGTSSKIIDENGDEKSVVEFYYRDNVISNPDLSNYLSVHFALRSALNVIAQNKKPH